MTKSVFYRNLTLNADFCKQSRLSQISAYYCKPLQFGAKVLVFIGEPLMLFPHFKFSNLFGKTEALFNFLSLFATARKAEWKGKKVRI